MESNSTILAWERIEGKAKVFVRCLVNGVVLHSDEINIDQAAQRDKFARRIAELGIDRKWADSRLLEIVAERRVGDTTHSTEQSDLEELEARAVVRPELIISAGAIAIAMPIHRMAPKGKIRSEWHHYVNDNGSRKRVPLGIVLASGGKDLIITPTPTPPSEDEMPRWSRASRNAWLNGAPTPDAHTLYFDIARAIDRYIEFPTDRRNETLGLLVCWIILTYVYQAWDRVGYLLQQGPPGSGKSTMMQILLELAFRALSTENITAPALFRTLHDRGGTLLLDEAERLRETRSPEIAEINSMLLAGYERKGRATRLERVDDRFAQVHFQVYGPKAIASINGVTPALASRCIVIRTERASKDSKKPKRLISEKDWQKLRDDLHLFVLGGHDWFAVARNRNVGRDLNARDYDVWQPILSIAALLEKAGVKGLTRMLEKYAQRLVSDAAELITPEPDVVLLRTLVDFSLSGENPTCQELLNRLNISSKVIFEKYTPGGISARLRNYGLSTHKSGSRREFRVTREQLVDIQNRYGIDLDLA